MYHKDLERVRLSVGQEVQKVLERADTTRDPIILECIGGPTVVVLNFEEFESISATLEVEEDAELREGLEESLKEAKAGRFFTHEEVFGHPIEQAPEDA